MKICVVEDEDILRISISDDLKEAGFQVSSMKSPTVALKILVDRLQNAPDGWDTSAEKDQTDAA
jgi:DNA-binding response OmpR family regulator